MVLIFGLDPLVFGLIIGLVAGAGIELSILWFAGRRWIPNRSAEVYNQKAAAGDLDDARDHFIAPIRTEIDSIRTEIESMQIKLEAGTDFEDHFNAFETRFSQVYKEDMRAIDAKLTELPGMVQMSAMSEKGIETRAVQAMMDDQGGEIVAAENMMQAIASENPEMVLATAMQKVAEWEPSKKYKSENPGKALAYEIGKPYVLSGMAKAYESLTGQKVGGGRTGNATVRKKFTSPYGP